MPKKYKVISLFSGAMGLDLGFDETGEFETLACIEKMHAYCDTIRENIKAKNIHSESTRVIEGDISDVDPKLLMEECGLAEGELDVIIGGPPCQSFSTAGKRKGVTDPRGTLLWRYLDFVVQFKPKVFMLENVRGLHSASMIPKSEKKKSDKKSLTDPGSVLRKFIDDLNQQASGYRIDCFLVNSANYGAPQIRERLFIIGNRIGKRFSFPEPTHGDSNSGLIPYRTLGDAIKSLHEKNQEVLDFSERKKKYLSQVPSGGNWRYLPVEIQQESMGKAFFAKGGRSGWWRRLSYDFPSPTLITMPNHASTSLCHPTEIRALSLREFAAIQEFPKKWKFCGTIQEKYAQAGNAVPVRLANVAARTIVKFLENPNEFEPASANDDAYVVHYLKSHLRTRMWFKDGDAYAANGNKEASRQISLSMKTNKATRRI